MTWSGLLHFHLESRLDSLIYVFDEPMDELHSSEKESMIEAIKELRELVNTVIAVLLCKLKKTLAK